MTSERKMNEVEDEKEMIRISEIFATLKKDAYEVSDLLIKGIESYKLLAQASVVIEFLLVFIWFSNWRWEVPYILSYSAAVAFLGVTAILSYSEYRKLKKPYKELVKLRKSAEE